MPTMGSRRAALGTPAPAVRAAPPAATPAPVAAPAPVTTPSSVCGGTATSQQSAKVLGRSGSWLLARALRDFSSEPGLLGPLVFVAVRSISLAIDQSAMLG